MYSLASSKLGKYCTTISPHNEESPKCQTEQILLIHITPHLTNKAQRREHPETTATSRDRYNFPIYVARRKQRRRKQRRIMYMETFRRRTAADGSTNHRAIRWNRTLCPRTLRHQDISTVDDRLTVTLLGHWALKFVRTLQHLKGTKLKWLATSRPDYTARLLLIIGHAHQRHDLIGCSNHTTDAQITLHLWQ